MTHSQRAAWLIEQLFREKDKGQIMSRDTTYPKAVRLCSDRNQLLQGAQEAVKMGLPNLGITICTASDRGPSYRLHAEQIDRWRLYKDIKPCVKDTDLLTRVALLIDCDFKDTSPESLERGFDKVKLVADYCAKALKQEPLIMLTGGGYHIVFKVQRHAQVEFDVTPILKHLKQRFDCDEFVVDDATGKPTTQLKVPGSISMKEGREDRIVKVASAPDTLEPVLLPWLKLLASEYVTTRPGYSNSDYLRDDIAIDQDQWEEIMEEYGLYVADTRHGDDGTWYILGACINKGARHRNQIEVSKSAFIWREDADGRKNINYKCLSDDCTDFHFKEALERLREEQGEPLYDIYMTKAERDAKFLEELEGCEYIDMETTKPESIIIDLGEDHQPEPIRKELPPPAPEVETPVKVEVTPPAPQVKLPSILDGIEWDVIARACKTEYKRRVLFIKSNEAVLDIRAKYLALLEAQDRHAIELYIGRMAAKALAGFNPHANVHSETKNPRPVVKLKYTYKVNGVDKHIPTPEEI
jgi:hypothetical protein